MDWFGSLFATGKDAALWVAARPRIAVRIISDDTELEVGGLRFEIENLSDRVTSLRPVVTLSYLLPDAKPSKIDFDVCEQDRTLAPYVPKTLSASARQTDSIRHHAWYRVYRFKPTRGWAKKVRIRNASLEELSLKQFLLEERNFKKGVLPDIKSSMSIEEFRAARRSRGPHGD
jgi:hypothetical protein